MMEDIAVGAIGGLAGVALVLAKGLVEAVVKGRNGNGEQKLNERMAELANSVRIVIDNTEALRRSNHDIVNLQKDISSLLALHEQGAILRDKGASEWRTGAVTSLTKTGENIEKLLTDAVQNGRIALANCPMIQGQSGR